MVSGFQLYCEGRFEEAIAAYSRELEATPSAIAMANRALARLSLGDYHSALADYRAAGELRASENSERSDGYEKKIGGVLWLMGHEQEASSVWEEIVDELTAGSIVFTDAAGGVQSGLLLWFSGSMLRDEQRTQKATKFLEKLSKRSASKNWPGPIGEYVLKQIDYRALMDAAQQQQTLALRRGCQGVFYAGVRASLEGDEKQAAEMLRMAMEYGEDAALEIEYFLAAHELKRRLLHQS